jgi:signal peptidase I
MNEMSLNQSINENVLIASNAEMLGLLEELLGEDKSVRLKIKGRSMLPLLGDGVEEVELSRPTDKEIIDGALVLFRYGDGFLLHRIIRRKENNLMLRGDNVFQSIEFVNTEQVIGIVRRIIYPRGRELSIRSLRWKILSTSWLIMRPLCRVSQSFINLCMRVLHFHR